MGRNHRVLSVKLCVTGLDEKQIEALTNEVIAQAEACEAHPDVPIVYCEVVGPAKDDRPDIFRDVLRAMQAAEELGGPDGYAYAALMGKIEREARTRAERCHYAKADLSVLMRPPRKGERGWWVSGRTPALALADVLGEMDDGCWIAERDYDGEPDDHGMIAITVKLGDAS